MNTILTVKQPETLQEYQKAQFLRLMDVPLGAFMVYMGYRSNLNIWLRLTLMTAGIGTALYNLDNYMKNRAENPTVGP